MSFTPFLQAVVTVCAPLAAILLPGLMVVRLKDFHDLLYNGARVFLWSAVLLIAGSFLAATLQIPMYYVAIAVGVVSFALLVRRRHDIFCITCGWTIMAVIAPIVLAFAAFAAPYFLRLDGLPTGDSQKAIFWAQNILETTSLPQYNRSIETLNRDPGDFFTPGLHTFTALLMSISPQPLISVGLVAIVLAVATAWLAAAISKEIFDDSPHIIPPLLAAIFVLTNFRFLRYLREPGYHYQNIVGEFLLFGLMLLGLRLLRRFAWADALLVCLLVLALVLSHQFTVFVGFFMVLPLAMAYITTYKSKAIWGAVGVSLGILAALGLPFGLYEKIPHLFTTETHLYSLLPTTAEYPLLLGPVWFGLGIAGFLLFTISTWKFQSTTRWSFIAATLVVLVLSQGPRIFLDIPPVRALLYAVVPLSIYAAYAIMWMRHYIDRISVGAIRGLLLIGLALLTTLPMIASVRNAFAGSNITASTNSTLTADHLVALKVISSRSTGVLIDDRGRRADSWLILGGQPMFTRLTSDIRRLMAESAQSGIRRNLYLRQLEFEKIYMLGSHPIAAYSISQQENLGVVAGVIGSSYGAFSHNPALHEISRAGQTVFFAPRVAQYMPSELDMWLLRTSTLVNDIGDREDTLQHLPISLRSPRVSDPQFDGIQTFRTTTSPIIPVEFNTGDYVERLWNQESTSYPDTDLELLITTVFGGERLQVATAAGVVHELTPGKLLTLPAHEVSLENGVARLEILNPTQELVGIDMIALGLARIP